MDNMTSEEAADLEEARNMDGNEDPVASEGVDTHLLIEQKSDEPLDVLVRRTGDGTAGSLGI
jgi:hypothetical protein